MTEELKKICQDIQRLVPPKDPREPTGPFLDFIGGLKNKVKDDDIEAIIRAYNYFNCLVSASLSMPAKISTAAKDETSTGSKSETSEAKPEAKTIPEEKQKEMISILLKLA